MGKPVCTDLDFRGGAQLVNGRAHNKTVAPAAPRPGQLWFDTTLNRLRWWNATEWVDLLQLIVAGPVRRHQFFPPGATLSLTITEQPSTLPASNNQITVHANGVRLFPDQPGYDLDWERDAINSPDLITLRQRDGEWVMIEWS